MRKKIFNVTWALKNVYQTHTEIPTHTLCMSCGCDYKVKEPLEKNSAVDAQNIANKIITWVSHFMLECRFQGIEQGLF